mmetsp:Transcript_29421/g.57545  ORF Transcript_29421/g.57545 Transcript_29421/m.57545 type:complete len:205 (-) Transcript_29421:322-936(-)
MDISQPIEITEDHVRLIVTVIGENNDVRCPERTIVGHPIQNVGTFVLHCRHNRHLWGGCVITETKKSHCSCLLLLAGLFSGSACYCSESNLAACMSSTLFDKLPLTLINALQKVGVSFASIVRWNDDKRANGRKNRVHAGTAEADMKHAADHEKQKSSTDTYDDRRDIPIAGEASTLRPVPNDTSDDHGAKKGEKHTRLLELLT